MNRIEPYNATEQRVAKWIVDRTGIGGGDDPVGWLLLSFDTKIIQMTVLQERLKVLEAIVEQSSHTCGQAHCNCPGASKIKNMVKEYKETYNES